MLNAGSRRLEDDLLIAMFKITIDMRAMQLCRSLFPMNSVSETVKMTLSTMGWIDGDVTYATATFYLSEWSLYHLPISPSRTYA